MKKVVIVSACRTAIGAFGGTLKDVPAAELGALVVKEAVSRAGIKPEQVDEVIFGIVLQAGLGQNVARQVTLKAVQVGRVWPWQPTRSLQANLKSLSAAVQKT